MDHFVKSQNLLLYDLFCIGKVYTLYLLHNTNSMILSEKVIQAKEEFILDVNALKYATTLTNTELSDSGLESAVRRVVISYENYTNSKIEFTDEYFKNK